MVFVQQVLSWFGESVDSNVKSNDPPQCETVSPASDLVTELNADSMEIDGYMVPPSTTDNGALATRLASPTSSSVPRLTSLF